MDMNITYEELLAEMSKTFSEELAQKSIRLSQLTLENRKQSEYILQLEGMLKSSETEGD